MGKIRLSYGENVQATIVFLNMFGLVLEEKGDIHLGDTLKIMDENATTVGAVIIDKEKININAQTELGLLKASYKTVTTSVITDVESKGCPKYGHWDTNIAYEIINSKRVKMMGALRVECSIDEEFGMKCFCRPSLEYLFDNTKTMSIYLQQDGKMFELNFFDGLRTEEITLRPFDSMNGYISYRVTEGVLDKEKGFYPYRKYSGIYQKSKDQPNQIKVLSVTEEQGIDIFKTLFFLDKIGEKNSKDFLIQFGSIMQELEPNMYEKIKCARNLLTANKCSLFDGFIRFSLGSYSYKEIESLLGVKRTPIIYQGTIKNLTDIYFGPNKQMRLTK